MIIVLFCLNHVDEISTEVLHDFIWSRGYTTKSFRQTYEETPIHRDLIAYYNNAVSSLKHFQVYVESSEMMHPKSYIDHYGNIQEYHALSRLQQLLEFK